MQERITREAAQAALRTDPAAEVLNVEAVPSVRRKYMITGVAVILISAASWIGYVRYAASVAEANRIQAQSRLDAQRKQVSSLLAKWTDALELAGMTSRVALAQPLSQMQGVRRELESLELDSCVKSATGPMVDGMNNAIFAFEMFVRYPNNSSASDSTAEYLSKSTAKLVEGKKMVAACSAVAE